MKWESALDSTSAWGCDISNLEEKKKIAQLVAGIVKNGDVIGFGSGSTSFLAALAIGNRVAKEHIDITAIPTSHEIHFLCSQIGIPVSSLLHDKPDWCFDGVDEIDSDGNMIKGRGGALFIEKLVMKSASRTYILADKSKFVPYLGYYAPVPIEVHPNALMYVERQLRKYCVESLCIRIAKGKDGPIITEHGNVILDAKFKHVYPALENELSAITGVIETGLFYNIRPEVLIVEK